MRKIVCLDLDNTLLKRQENEYHSAVIDGLCKSLRYSLPADCNERLTRSINHLTRKNSPNITLEESFISSFVSDCEHLRNDVYNAIHRFYREDYQKLSRYISPKPGAVDFVEEAFKDGYELVIATNPIYPQQAVLQRLSWAGLSDWIHRFSIISSMERFHFTKPNPAFYSEIQAKLGWPENVPILMVGDSLEMDILPASKAGMMTFWLNDNEPSAGRQNVHQTGSFLDLAEWFDAFNPATSKEDVDLGSGDIFSHLRATPAAIHSICQHLSSDLWYSKPGDDEWSIVEIVCHLRDADQCVNIPRFKEALRKENPFLPSIDADSWVSDHSYLEENGSKALFQMLNARIEFLELLEGFPGEWWKKNIRHSVFGPTSLAELIMFIVTHDKIHLRQLLRAYRAATEKTAISKF